MMMVQAARRTLLASALGGWRVFLFGGVLLAFPFIAPYQALATQILVYSLFALSFDVFLGYTGMLSLGHSAFFGLGAYSTGMWLVYGGWSLEFSLAMALPINLLAAFLIGALCLRKGGIYFAMLTLALSQVFYYAVIELATITGGSDGLSGIPRLYLNYPWRVDLFNPLARYYFVLVVVGIASLLIALLLRSPFGHVMRAVRENEERASACGYDVARVKLVSFMISGMFSGLAGGLYVVTFEVCPIENFHWFLSGTVVIITVLGGSGVFLGPFVGAAAFLFLRDFISLYSEYWEFIVGASFILIMIFLPDGIVGTLQRLLGGLLPGSEGRFAGAKVINVDVAGD